MKKKESFTFALLLMVICSCFSYNPKIIDTLKIHQQIKKFGLDEKIINFKANFFESIVFKNDSVIYYNPDGSLHVFEIHLGILPHEYVIFQKSNMSRLTYRICHVSGIECEPRSQETPNWWWLL